MNWEKKITQKQFWIVIVVMIIWFVFSFTTFIYFKKECEMAKENPLKYAAKRYDLDSCLCLTASGDNLFFNKTRVLITGKRINFYHEDISKLNGGLLNGSAGNN